jgi:hypothetical protein
MSRSPRVAVVHVTRTKYVNGASPQSTTLAQLWKEFSPVVHQILAKFKLRSDCMGSGGVGIPRKCMQGAGPIVLLRGYQRLELFRKKATDSMNKNHSPALRPTWSYVLQPIYHQRDSHVKVVYVELTPIIQCDVNRK